MKRTLAKCSIIIAMFAAILAVAAPGTAGAAVQGTLTGTVVNGASAPIQGVVVRVTTTTGTGVASTTTNPSGVFSINLNPGSYKVRFEHPNYLVEWYDNAASVNTANAVAVNGGATTTLNQTQLADAAVITGNVTSVSPGGPLPGVRVQALTTSGVGVISAATDAAGNYTLPSLPGGTYKLRFSKSLYASEFYDDKATLAAADPITVAVTTTTTGINAALLANAGSISGTVTDATTSSPISGVVVKLFNAVTQTQVTSVTTTPSGTYLLDNVAPDNYYVRFADPSGFHVGNYYVNGTNFATATIVPVTAGTALSGINGSLAQAGIVTGTVTDEVSTLPLSGIKVIATNTSTSAAYSTTTIGSGTYTFLSLPPGTYRVNFSDPTGTHASEFFDDAPTSGTATPVNVNALATTSGIDAALARRAALAGQVTLDGVGTPVPNALIRVRTTGNVGVASGRADASGNFLIGSIPVGTYVIFIEQSGYTNQYYDRSLTFAGAAPVALTDGATTNVPIALVP